MPGTEERFFVEEHETVYMYENGWVTVGEMSYYVRDRTDNHIATVRRFHSDAVATCACLNAIDAERKKGKQQNG